ncbi:hypothetical protein SKAU_G00342170 [Synaphobranchus kaupii]|uniref:Uncharacterized protein n=1 Tax=Synaphobranchus kaupii TaxID=118154 RepID=A0A9Q1IJJ1_SYNKA|nr:hypothetical protein SKAU_G00342170 [Synaphobranchus kaupii]
MHDHFRVLTKAAPPLPVSEIEDGRMAESSRFTRCLLELPKVTVNDVRRIARMCTQTPQSKLEKAATKRARHRRKAIYDTLQFHPDGPATREGAHCSLPVDCAPKIRIPNTVS